MKNVCDKCKYLEVDTSCHDGEYDYFCKCGLEEEYSLNGNGCNYSKEILSLLQKYRSFEISEIHQNRVYDEGNHLIDIENDIKKRQDNGEKVSIIDLMRLDSEREHYYELLKMNYEYKRCQYLRFFKKNDPEGKLRRHLKRKGQYPYWIHDLFYVENYDKYEEKE